MGRSGAASFRHVLGCSTPMAQEPHDQGRPKAGPNGQAHYDVPVVDVLGAKGDAVEPTHADRPRDPYADNTVGEEGDRKGEG